VGPDARRAKGGPLASTKIIYLQNAVFVANIDKDCERFAAMTNVMDTFSVLIPAVLSKADESEIVFLGTKLQESYPDDLPEAFPIQVACFRATLVSSVIESSCQQHYSEYTFQVMCISIRITICRLG